MLVGIRSDQSVSPPDFEHCVCANEVVRIYEFTRSPSRFFEGQERGVESTATVKSRVVNIDSLREVTHSPSRYNGTLVQAVAAV